MLPILTMAAAEERERVRSLVERTPVEPIAERPADTGLVAVEGRVRKHREAVTPRLDGGEAVFARYERIRRDGEGPGPGGETVERAAETAPFVVEDDSGGLLVDLGETVDAAGDPVIVSASNTERYLGDEDGADLVPFRTDGSGDAGVGDLARARSELGETPDWIHVQSTLRPGDRVYVLGDVAETPGGSPPYVLSPGPDDTVVCSDLSQSALLGQLDRESAGVDRRFWAFAALGLVALAIVVVAVGVFVDSFLL